MGKPINEKCLACSKVDFHGVDDHQKPECWVAARCYKKRNYYKYLEVKRTYQRKIHYYLRYCQGNCAICQSTEQLQAHHIKAQSLGGEHTKTNVMTLCSACHATVTRYYQAVHGLKQAGQ